MLGFVLDGDAAREVDQWRRRSRRGGGRGRRGGSLGGDGDGGLAVLLVLAPPVVVLAPPVVVLVLLPLLRDGRGSGTGNVGTLPDHPRRRGRRGGGRDGGRRVRRGRGRGRVAEGVRDGRHFGGRAGRGASRRGGAGFAAFEHGDRDQEAGRRSARGDPAPHRRVSLRQVRRQRQQDAPDQHHRWPRQPTAL